MRENSDDHDDDDDDSRVASLNDPKSTWPDPFTHPFSSPILGRSQESKFCCCNLLTYIPTK